MKKSAIFAALAVSLAANVAQANAFSKAYVGAGVGLTNASANIRNYVNNVAVTKTRTGDMSPVGSIFAGVNAIYKHLYVGFEANAKMFHFKAMTQDLLGTSNTHKNNFSYGVALRVGALMTPSTLGYIGLGAQNYRWRLHTNSLVTSKNKNKIFLEPSVGMETALKKNVNVGIKVSQAIRKKFTYISAANRHSTFRPNMTTAEVRVSFSW